jgi:DNA repair and recombination RAD54-like protein
LAPFQQDLYNVFLTSPEIKSLLKGQGSQPLKAITLLKKLCNHPNLLNLPDELEGCEKVLPAGYLQTLKRSVDSQYSGKFTVLAR